MEPFGPAPSFGPPPIIFTLVPLLIGGVIIYAIVKGIAEWSNNNAQPVLTSQAYVLAKRVDVSTHHTGTHDHHHGHSHMHDHTDTTYYVTFQLATGERREIRMAGHEYGQLAEGDQGQFTYQGTRYLGFARQV